VPPENVAPLKLTVPGEAFGGGGGTELGGGGGEPFVEPGQLEVPLPAVGDDQGDRGAQAGDHGQDDLRGVLTGGALVQRTDLPRPVPTQQPGEQPPHHDARGRQADQSQRHRKIASNTERHLEWAGHRPGPGQCLSYRIGERDPGPGRGELGGGSGSSARS